MNIQKMMKEAQKIQKDMMLEQTKIEETIFTSKSSIVNIEMKGNKELISVKILSDEIQKDEIEMLEDMILVAINDVIGQINKETETRLGKYTQGMPGLF